MLIRNERKNVQFRQWTVVYGSSYTMSGNLTFSLSWGTTWDDYVCIMVIRSVSRSFQIDLAYNPIWKKKLSPFLVIHPDKQWNVNNVSDNRCIPTVYPLLKALMFYKYIDEKNNFNNFHLKQKKKSPTLFNFSVLIICECDSFELSASTGTRFRFF